MIPIGHVETPWATVADCPRNGRKPEHPPLCHAVIRPEFIAGLASLEGFSHLILVTLLDEAPEPRLVFIPPFDSHPRGVFATRAPWRPNPIGVTVVALEGVEGPGRLAIRYMDCRNGTPILDIKPYLRTVDSVQDSRMGWLEPNVKAEG